MDIRLDKRILDALVADMGDDLDDWLAGEAEEIVTDVKLSFNTSPPGATYTRGTVTHVASLPGSPPNVDIGTLRASIRSRKVRHLHFEVHDGVDYGILLEEGTERMGARPFMGPVVDAHGRTLGSRFPRLV